MPTSPKPLGKSATDAFERVLFKGVGLTIAVLVGVVFAVSKLFGWIDLASLNLPLIGPNAIVGGLLSIGGVALTLMLSIFLMIPVASAMTSMMLEDVARAVEERHYPHLKPPEPLTFRDSLRDSVVALGVLICCNAIALALLPFFWFAAPFIFIALNGFLLGREYFLIVAMRHLGRDEAYAARRAYRFQIWAAGILMAFPLAIPVMNLFIPILGAATFTHMFQRLRTI